MINIEIRWMVGEYKLGLPSRDETFYGLDHIEEIERIHAVVG